MTETHTFQEQTELLTNPTCFSKPFSFFFSLLFFSTELGTAQAGLQTHHIAEGDPELILLPQIIGFEPWYHL